MKMQRSCCGTVSPSWKQISHDITSEKTGRKRLSQYVRKVYFTKEDSGVFLSKGSINHFPEDISRTLFFTVPWSCEGSMFQVVMGVVVNFEISFAVP